MNNKETTDSKPAWSSESIGSRFQHNFFYLLIKIGGRRLPYAFLHLVVFYYVLFVPSVRPKTDPYLSRMFPGRSLFQRFSDRYRMVLNLGKTLIDRAMVGILGPGHIKASFATDEDYRRFKDLDTGCILMMSHVGCWQVAMASLGIIDRPVNLLMQRDEKDIDKHYFEHGSGGDSPLKIIDPAGFLGGAIEMLDVLKKDEVLCVMGDRVFGDPNGALEVDFLGGKALFPYSAFKIASLSDKPVMVLYSRKTGPDSYEIRLADEIFVPPKLGRKKENFAPYVKAFVTSLETFAMENPYQFYNFYDMWEPTK